MIEFKIIATPERSQVGNYQHLANDLRFGSAEGDMIIDDPDISEQQARIYLEGTQFFVENLDPSVPVKVNSQLVDGSAPIKTRDSLVIGKTTIQMSLLDPNPISPPEPFTHQQAVARFVDGSKEKAILDVLELLSGDAGGASGAEKAGDTPPPMPQGMPKPPPLPK